MILAHVYDESADPSFAKALPFVRSVSPNMEESTASTTKRGEAIEDRESVHAATITERVTEPLRRPEDTVAIRHTCPFRPTRTQ